MTNRAEPAVAVTRPSCPASFSFAVLPAALDDCLNVSTSASHFATDIRLRLITDYHVTRRFRQPLYASLSPAVQGYHQPLLDLLSFPLARDSLVFKTYALTSLDLPSPML